MTAKDKITLLIVDDIPETRENLRKLLYFEPDIEIVGMAASGREAIDKAKALQPNIVLMDINMPDMDGIQASQQITRVAPVCQVIMMSVQSEADYLRRSMLAGAMDFLTKPFSSEELSSSIHRVYEMGASRRMSAPPVASADAQAPGALGVAARRATPGGKLLLIYSPKGGTGCSTVAVNLAIALQQVTSKKVALVDGSLQFGDISVLLNLQGNRSIAEAVAEPEKLDADWLTTVMSPHASGIKVLPAPPSPEMAEAITPEHLKKLLEVMRKAFDLIVFDSWRRLDDTILTAMEAADRIVMVMTPEIPSIKSTKQFFELVEALQLPTDRIDLILNQVTQRDTVRGDQIEGSLKHALLAQLALDTRAVRLAANQGLPLLLSEPNHPLSQCFLQLARQEVAALQPPPVKAPEEAETEEAEERKKRPGLLGRLKR